MFKRTSRSKWFSRTALAVTAAAVISPAISQTDLSSVPLPTYAIKTVADIKSNILFVLDDSYSMIWDFLPDWANDIPPNQQTLNPTPVCDITLSDGSCIVTSTNTSDSASALYHRLNNDYNAVAYSPNIRYEPPVTFSGTSAARSSLPSMTAANTTNWTVVPRDAYGVHTTNTANLTQMNWLGNSSNPYQNALSAGFPFYYTTVPGEYCTSPSLTTCTAATAPTGSYTYPATLRWCSDTALTTCRATQGNGFVYPRMPVPRSTRIRFTGVSNAVISSVTVDGVSLMSAATTAQASSNALARAVADRINACFSVTTSPCVAHGYQAYVANTTDDFLTLVAPSATTATPTVVRGSGTVTIATSAIGPSTVPIYPLVASGGTASAAGAAPGENLLTVLRPALNVSETRTYPKAAGRTDCAAATFCTYTEEMTNYANWFAYYRTRMQTMKSAASRAFATLDTDADIAADKTQFRVGYMSINNVTGSDFVNITDFNGAQKVTWYSRLFAASPGNGGTPLRRALAQAGQLYGGKYNGQTLNGTTVVDPLQYSCQRNFTILSTDGYWNGTAGTRLDQSTAIGNVDGLLPRPYNDGATGSQLQSRTSNLQQRTVTQTADRGTLQSQTSQLQTRVTTQRAEKGTLQAATSTLQRVSMVKETRTSTNGGSTWSNWTAVQTCTPTTNVRECRDRETARSNATSCSVTTPASNGTYTLCQYTAWTAFTDVSSCTVAAQSPGPTSYSVGTARQCQYRWDALANTQTCSPAFSATSFSNATVYRNCTVTTGNWTDTSSCTPNSTYNSSGVITACQYTAWSAWADASSCTPQARDGSSPFTIGLARQCQYVYTTVGTPTCTPAFVSGNFSNPTVYRNCTSTPGTWNNVSSCTVSSTPDSGGVTTECQYTAWTGWSNVSSCTASPQSTGPGTFTVGNAQECQTIPTGGGVSDSLADVAAYYFLTDLRSPTATGADATGTCTGPIIAPSTVANDLCTNNVPVVPGSRNTNTKQHMVTHTLGMGIPGAMVYSQYQNDAAGNRRFVPDYWQQVSGDFYSVASGAVPNASSGVCSWMTSGNCNWPTPAADSPSGIDDLWHAAVNGQGTYFSARDPAAMVDALRSVLQEITKTPRPGTAAAAASSNPNVTSADNYVFSSSYRSIDWFGELVMQRIDTETGIPGAQQWSAMQMLDCATTPWVANRTYESASAFRVGSTCYRVKNNQTYTAGSSFDSTATAIEPFQASTAPTSRTIYTAFNGSRINFTWGTLDASQQAFFTTPAIELSGTNGLTQFCTTGPLCLNSTARTAAAGQALVDFIRGDRSNEGVYFRTRKRVLGDIVSSEARYIKQAQFSYGDAGYSAFKTATVSRAATVYVGANDGMLHAFDVADGRERWAFIPPAVLPEVYRLADVNYDARRRYFVDGTPEIGDICPTAPTTACTSSTWKTILVGGLNLGGKSFYALDITDPNDPKFLWEFSHANMGYSYGNPRITKLANGTWVVIVATGHNNSDGIGRVFVLNANTGAVIGGGPISTGVGTATSPSGLTRLSARSVDPNIDNTVTAVYGGDLLGNVWRIDVNDNIGASGRDAQLMIQVSDAAGTAQPITARPVVGSIAAKPVIVVGTGRYLGISDIANTQRHSLYAFKYEDSRISTLPTPRSTGSNFILQTVTAGTCPADAPTSVCSPSQSVRTVTTNAVDWNTRNGWYLDLPTGEMSFTDASLALGSLVFTTSDPQSAEVEAITCGDPRVTPSGALSYLWFLDFATGSALLGTSNVGGVSLGSGIATRPSLFRTQDGSVKALIRISGTTGEGTDMGGTIRREIPVGGTAGTTPGRRSWRILNGDN